MKVFILLITLVDKGLITNTVFSFSHPFKEELHCLKSAEYVKNKYENKYSLFRATCEEKEVSKQEEKIQIKKQ